MGKLKMIKPRLAVLPNRLSIAKPATREEQEAQRLRLRDQNVKWREWYKSARWQRLRQQVFIRDSYICQQTGAICMGRHPADDSPVAHHKTPHRGDEALALVDGAGQRLLAVDVLAGLQGGEVD